MSTRAKRWRRTAIHVVTSWSGAVRAVADCGAASVIVDVEPTVAAWGSDVTALENGLTRVTSEIGQLPTVREIVFLTNSSRPAPPVPSGARTFNYRARARKPWRLWSLRTLPDPIVVIGDQILTDGLLAHRLAASFVHLQRNGEVPWWPAAQAFAGRFLRTLFFREPR
jgi:hypothetical protein